MTLGRVARIRSINHPRSFSTTSAALALSNVARSKANQLSQWKGTSVIGETTKNFIGGEFVDSKSSEWTEVLDPVMSIIMTYAGTHGNLDHTNITLHCTADH